MTHKPSAPLYRLTLPASGIGPMTYAPVDAKKKFYGSASSITPDSPEDTSIDQEIAEAESTGGEEASTEQSSPQEKGYTPDPIKRRAQRRKSTLAKHLFNIMPPPSIEAFLRFEGTSVKWTKKEVWDGLFDMYDTEWHLKLHGKKPNLDTLRKKLINRLSRRYKDSGGYFLYRWRLEWGRYGTPDLYLHLLGESGEGHSLEDVAKHLSAAWAELADIQNRQNDSLCWVQSAHASSRQNFCSPLDGRLDRSLEHLLNGRYEWGRVLKSNIPEEKPIQLRVTAAQLKAVRGIILDHLATRHYTSTDVWRMLTEANFGNVFLNEKTGPLVRQALGLE